MRIFKGRSEPAPPALLRALSDGGVVGMGLVGYGEVDAGMDVGDVAGADASFTLLWRRWRSGPVCEVYFEA